MPRDNSYVPLQTQENLATRVDLEFASMLLDVSAAYAEL